MDPGEDQKPSVVDDKMQLVFALFDRPTDEAVTRSRFPGYRAESRKSENAVGSPRDMAQLRTGERMLAQVVLAIDALVP